ncbi:REP-associated tyrosine transposase [Oxynema aestuarii]|uniref:Transposase n=1 Tax=Oxynema aestuarii AP17 TaxID=2064643 RepID=A0A6H1U0E2_9CYAN|nr:transposase [Oxynema aestuarii]QIZ71630.1 transposase [Oxynema aestuarii AP17]
MAEYRREYWQGATYFFTQVTCDRQPWLCDDMARVALRQAIETVRRKRPFQIDAFVLLPDHFHCLWTLPENDGDFSTRMRLVKSHVTRAIGDRLNLETTITASRKARRERNLWQRRFWEHRVRDEQEFAAYCDYIHINPVKHGLCKSPTDWPWSSIHRFIRQGIYPPDWGQ